MYSSFEMFPTHTIPRFRNTNFKEKKLNDTKMNRKEES